MDNIIINESPINILKKEVDPNICTELVKLQVPASLKGYPYICYAINWVVDNTTDFSMTELYMKVAQRFGSTYQRVERSMRKCIEYTFDHMSPRDIKKNFGSSFDDCKGKMTNKEFVTYVAMKFSGLIN